MDTDASEAQRAELAKQRQRYESQLESDYLWIMNTHTGRRFVWDLVAPLWRSSYTGNREDTDFREGERNVALKIWARLRKSCPSLALKMQEENAT
jgi:hypothetical protein